MAESLEEFDSLFDYRRVQPLEVVCLDDDEDSASSPPKRTKVDKKEKTEKVPPVVNLDDNQEEEEEDWLPPPPKCTAKATKKLGENSTLKELRLRKQEMISITQSAEFVLERGGDAENSTSELTPRAEAAASVQQPSSVAPPPYERMKIVLSIQGKDGAKQFRVYADEKFEKVFKSYADIQKLRVESLVFSFDGDRINPAATPQSLGMEDNDMIETYQVAAPPPPCERMKIVLSIQGKDGAKQFRVYADVKFEKVFKLYADIQKLRVDSLVFSFDGDRINPAATPQSLEMEDNDIIEVRLC